MMPSPSLSGLLCLLLSFQPTFSQVNPLFQDPLAKDPASYKFSLTSHSDCSDDLKNIYDFEATIIGYETNSLDTGPTDCTIRLTSQDQFPNIQLSVKVIAANILDCDTTLGIYDGQEGHLLESFDCRSVDLPNRRLYPTSGDTVTFRFSRPNPSSYGFDIQIRVQRLRGGPNPDDGWGWGKDYFFDKFPQEAIVGMIGGFYLLILIICLTVIVYFNFKYRGVLKRWETHQLSTMKSGTVFDSRSHLTEPSNVWATDRIDNRAPPSYYSRSQAEPYSRRHRGGGGASVDGSSVHDHDEAYQLNPMNNRRDQKRYRDQVASENSSFTGSEDDDPDHFVEKVITPRVKSRPKGRRNQRPPSFEEAISERSYEHSSEDEETASSEASSTKKRITSSEEETSSKSASETETESEDDSRRGARAKKQKWTPKKNRRRRRSSSDGETSSHRSGPRSRQPAASAAAPVAVPYAGYPPGQFVPVMAGPPAFQPVHMVPNYPPPHFPEEPQTQPRKPQVQPTDPPVYSYLVRRGYTPLDANTGRHSPASNNSSHRGPPEEPESALQSGVEYMRR